MNIEQTKEAIKVMQAFVDGKEVECCDSVFEGLHTTNNPSWDWVACIYRIKPTPTIRPWTADEVPLGAWIKLKHDDDWKSLILEVDRIGKICVYGGTIFCEAALENHEHSTDGGKTWLPCGVMEEGK
jgi:hypothetical protein